MRHDLRYYREWYLRKKIRTKINIIYTILIVFQTLIFMIGAGIIFSNAMIKNGIEQLCGDSRLVISSVSNLMENAESYANDLTVRLNNYFISDNNLPSNEYEKYNRNAIIKKSFRNVMYVYQQIFGVMFVGIDGTTIVSDNLHDLDNYKEIMDFCIGLDDNGSESCNWIGMNQYYFVGGAYNVCVYCKKVININTGKPIGYLSVMLEESTFSKIYTNAEGIQDTSYIFCDNKGNVVSSTEKATILKPVENKELKEWIINGKGSYCILPFNGKRMLVTKMPFSKMNWQVIGIVPVSKLLESSRQIITIVALLGIICLGGGIFISTKLSLSITKPLRTLITDVENLNLENLNDVTKIDSDDDVGMLAKSFNVMKRRINELLVNNQIEKENQRRLELKLLQDQIKPHFFYNTLQMVYAMIDMGDREKAQKSIKCLADFYRITLNNGHEIITMEEELANTEDYLYIQKIRYTDSFDYQMECANELKQYRILKLVLQPIVENIINHGFKGKKTKGLIQISVQKKEDRVLIEVSDNGIGMDPEKVASLLQEKEKETRGSFGLHNIDERIKLYFGQSYGLKVSSKMMEGTTVSIYLPAFEINQNI